MNSGTENHSRQGGPARTGQAARQRQPSLQNHGLQPRQLLPAVGRKKTTAALVSGATRFFNNGLRRDNSCNASSPPLS